ncbi:MAG: hypothetical protein AVDCRST_MAG29-996 [uncultured Nocardioidaceae bacterium]|uniref:DUF8129 domain-containing protein n=1 Tax=uncultured Nocardioidaceae bacterium TaxID=253824 RepID=A0A6J4LEQ6_9ACTN|nr:MAG: hypothetical protein AVDCRST_MAG29-996 [uncultured Nocardioidaceae bacterium]
MTQAPDRDDLPLPEFDHLPLGTLPSRIHSLDASGVSKLLAFERAHGNRLPVVLVLERRLEALGNDAEPSGSLPPDMPELSEGHGGSPVSPQTSGPPINPPSQGDPTNPAQPR